MKRNKGLIAATCISLSLLVLLGLFSAVWWVAKNADSLQLGGLVGELLEQQSDALLESPSDAPVPDTSAEELLTSDQQTGLEADTDPPISEDSPMLRFFLSGCDSWSEGVRIKTFKDPSSSLHWDNRAVIDDPFTDTLRIWGWAALFEQMPLQLGYRIDGGEAIYGQGAELTDADQAATNAALGMGAVSATAVSVRIPVKDLYGTHTVEILIRPLGGREGVICTLEIEKT